jgi:predicted unusual protein kinase regulating ubiquinone biosynthesis (AarF/ABC1/UbiB family)
MISKIILKLKWFYFLYTFNKNYNWITTTIEGMLYLKNKLNGLGIIGIKLGQYLYSTMDLSNNLKKILEEFLSNNKTHSLDETLSILNNNNNIDDILSIDETILGSGSLCQTHICYLNNYQDTKFVLKIVHPEVLKLNEEIDIVEYILNKLSYYYKINIDWVGFLNSIRIQADLTHEAKNIEKFYNMYKDYDKIEIPKLIHKNKYYIIMSYCDGVHLNTLDNESDLYISATNLISSCTFHSLYFYSIMHGDLHYGNVLVKPNGHIALIDFGLCVENNSSIDDDEENEIMYTIQEFLYNKNLDTFRKLINLFLTEEQINNFEVLKFFQEYMIQIIKFRLTNKNASEYSIVIKSLLITCNKLCIFLNSNIVLILSQLVILESLAYHISHNGYIYLRTLSFMKKEPFYMDKMSAYINKFYQLEYDNERDDNVKLLYP